MNELRLRITTSYNFVKGDGGCEECKLFNYCQELYTPECEGGLKGYYDYGDEEEIEQLEEL